MTLNATTTFARTIFKSFAIKSFAIALSQYH
jgi:hypothetical protein